MGIFKICSGTFIDSNIQKEYEEFKKTINQKILDMEKRPSFDMATIEIEAGETKNITDTNDVLKDYSSIDKTYNEIRFQHNKGENTLTITVPENCEIENINISNATLQSLGMVKEATKNNDTNIYFEFSEGVQNQLYSLHYNDPVGLDFKIKVNQLGHLELSKLNSNGDLIDGSIFTVSGSGYNGDVEVKNGKITLEKIKKGTYTIKEKTAPTGYLLNTQTYTVQVNSNETAKQAIVNNEPTGEITIKKEDTDLKNSKRIDGTIHHGDVNIAGAEYTLYADENIYNKSKTVKYFSKDEEIATFIFDEEGKASIKIISKNANLKVNGSTLTGLALGNYYAKETKVPTGYIQDTEKHIYSLNYKDSNTKVISINDTVKNTVQKAKFKIIKISGKDNSTAKVVKDAEFTAILTKYVNYYGSFDEALKHIDEYSEDEYAIFKTDENGYGTSNLLAYGEYTVNETVTPSPELNTVEEFYVTIDRNSDGVIKELVENDTPFESYLKIIKIDENTGKKITFSNATFSLYKLNKETNEWEQVSCKVGKEYRNTWTTDENGNIVDKWTSTNESHHVKGLEENKKYTLTEITAPYGYEIAESIDFVVSKDKETQKIEMKDMPILKSVQIEKLDKATGKNIKLNKFEFGIYENEECTKLIRKVSSDENKGIALFDKLKFGTYYIKETKAPLGYKLSNQVVEIVINDEGVFADDIEIEEKDDVYSINYYNSLQPVIQTGNQTNYALLFGLLGVSLVGAITGIVVLRRSRK